MEGRLRRCTGDPGLILHLLGRSEVWETSPDLPCTGRVTEGDGVGDTEQNLKNVQAGAERVP